MSRLVLTCALFTSFAFGQKGIGVLEKESAFLPEALQFCVTPKGCFITHVNDQFIGHFMAKGYHWEDHLVNACFSYITSDSIVLDIGANIGTHTVPWARKAAQVYAFEPQRIIFQQLCANLVVNGIHNVVSINGALGHERRKTRMDAKIPELINYYPAQDLTYERVDHPINFGGARLGDDGEDVEMYTLDSFQLDNVSLMKVDVEGAEPLVFYGARETIRRNKPVIIYEKRPDIVLTEAMKKSMEVPDEVANFDIERFIAQEMPDAYYPAKYIDGSGDRILLPKWTD